MMFWGRGANRVAPSIISAKPARSKDCSTESANNSHFDELSAKPGQQGHQDIHMHWPKPVSVAGQSTY